MVDLLSEYAAHDRAAVLERHRRVVSDGGEERPLLLGERRVRSQTSSPITRPFQRSGKRIAWSPERPSGHAILPSSRTSAAPVAPTASIVVSTIASSDSSR